MATLNDLKTAIRKGDTELVRELVRQLKTDGVYIDSALQLAKDLNKTKAKRGQWQDIIDVIYEEAEHD